MCWDRNLFREVRDRPGRPRGPFRRIRLPLNQLATARTMRAVRSRKQSRRIACQRVGVRRRRTEIRRDTRRLDGGSGATISPRLSHRTRRARVPAVMSEEGKTRCQTRSCRGSARWDPSVKFASSLTEIEDMATIRGSTVQFPAATTKKIRGSTDHTDQETLENSTA